MTIEEAKKTVVAILKEYGVKKAGFFGSLVTGQQTTESDIDILVEIEDKQMSLLDFVGLKIKLEDALGREVDLIEYDTIKPIIKDGILKQQVLIL